MKQEQTINNNRKIFSNNLIKLNQKKEMINKQNNLWRNLLVERNK